MRTDLAVVLPIAGVSSRMEAYGPKALVGLWDGQTVLSRQLSMLEKVFPFAEVVAVVGFEAERMMRVLPAHVRMVENEHYTTTNVARSILLGLRAASARNVLVVYGDIVFDEQALRCLPPGRSSLLLQAGNISRNAEVGVIVQGGKVESLSYGLPLKWAHISLLAEREQALFRKFASRPDRRKHYGFEILNEVLDSEGELLAIQPPGLRLAEIDSPKDIQSAINLFKS